MRPCVAGEATAQGFGRAGAEVLDQLGGGGAQDGEAGQDGLMSDVSGDHRLAQSVVADEGEIATFPDEVEGERALDEIALDLLRPVPVEIHHRLEAPDAGSVKSAFLAAPALVDLLEARDLLQNLHGREAALGGARQKVVAGLPDGVQADLQEATGEVS